MVAVGGALGFGMCGCSQRGVHGCSGGPCMVAPGGWGMCGCSWGHAWLLRGACVVALGEGVCVVAPGGCMVAPRGVCGCSRGACMVAPRGHAWLLQGGMHVCSWGACMVPPVGACVVAPGGMHGCSQGGMRGIRRDTEIRSMSGQYASYWNAFLLMTYFYKAGGGAWPSWPPLDPLMSKESTNPGF